MRTHRPLHLLGRVLVAATLLAGCVDELDLTDDAPAAASMPAASTPAAPSATSAPGPAARTAPDGACTTDDRHRAEPAVLASPEPGLRLGSAAKALHKEVEPAFTPPAAPPQP